MFIISTWLAKSDRKIQQKGNYFGTYLTVLHINKLLNPLFPAVFSFFFNIVKRNSILNVIFPLFTSPLFNKLRSNLGSGFFAIVAFDNADAQNYKTLGI